VTFDIDANGILNVSAAEKSTQKVNKITITNDKGRLSKEDIERMVQEAERYHAEDESQRNRVVAKNNLESYCFNMKNAVEDSKVKEKIAEDDRKRIADTCNHIIKWLDTSASATEDEFVAKLKEAEQVCKPIITKLYETAGAPSFGRCSGQGGSPSSGPIIEEVE
ncbi:heat shock 70 kDa protein 1B-like, partial [Hylaeus anthracinus]|uniref:heat shock 70 kDa protein 1B-like n=1 Tax=Hylaeus anthracinus TaxID=313031 RepID=UPI0023BA203D